ncbi:hypothetical protein ABL78_0279 [Leptomonas seymouri]|uniref:Uncharacterized protein n=1 Tax=Leptomonas seymouri TaxID=5684 RepID=A0A0N0P8Z5_LEPSE|nr:hypothetical protein ABL78_0279 [Leptomonas seymouri]|eukprot:KPI90519.1 hypothetical protein ABL78_0279 [Leptomonas seymouri]
MNRLARCVARRRKEPLRCAVWGAVRWQTSTFSSQPVGDEYVVSTTFPVDEATTTAASSVHSAKPEPSRRRRPGIRSGEADVLLKDIINLEKQVAVEQQRQRFSVRASELGSSATPTVAAGSRKSAPSTAAGSVVIEVEGVRLQEKHADATAPPVLSVPSAGDMAAAASRARKLESGMPAFLASSPSPPAAPSAVSPLPPLQTWTPPFALTSEHLRMSLEGPASEVAFTLEELEDTLFSSCVEAETSSDGGAGPSPSAPPPPSPAMSPSVPSLPHEREPSAGAADAVDEIEMKKQEAKEFSDSVGEAEAFTDHAPVLPNSTTPPSSSSRPSTTRQERPPGGAPKPLSPALRCELRGTAVVVTMSRVTPNLYELVEALQEAATFAESLPPMLQELREVRLRVDPSAPECSTPSFICASDFSEVISPTERPEVPLMKERLLRRIQEGRRRGLRYVAEIRVPSSAAPTVLPNFAAELLLACEAHEVLPVVAPNSTCVGGSEKDAVRLSFSGIGVGVFPAPATVCRVRELVKKIFALTDEQARLLALLGPAFSESNDEEAACRLARVTTNLTLCLHLLPAGVSTALLAAKSVQDEAQKTGGASALVSSVKSRLSLFFAPMLQQWLTVRQSFGGMNVLLRAPDTSTKVSLATCVTSAQVWSWMCEAVLRPGATDETTRDSVMNAMRATPLWRFQRCYLAASASLAALHSLPLTTPNEIAADLTASLSPPYLVEVSASTLAQTSVADLSSEVRDQPSDVVLVIAASVPLEQRLRFLASLRLTDTGDHHQVLVLLPGKPLEIDECVLLTRSSARLVSEPWASECESTTVSPAEPSWLHQTVEVSVARAPHPTVSDGGKVTTEVSSAVQYVTKKWHRPCVVTAKSEIGLALCTAAHSAEKYAQNGEGIASMGATASIARKKRWQRSLAPLVMLSHDTLSMVLAASAPEHVSSQPHDDETGATTRGATVDLGLAFLMVLDAACQALCREAGFVSPEVVNVLSVAALQLDASAGGVFDAADRVSGNTVEHIVIAMETAAEEHLIPFASLSLLRWMVEEQLLFCQLNRTTMARFAESQPQG